ncbi:expressed unknown protein (Partial), partial [Seminavis robusta]|eukprot:Sro2862_g338810.1 n/a (749) ;mRNA; r:2-2248
MQYGGNQQQRILNMMMQARQQQARLQQPGQASLYSGYPHPPHGLAPRHGLHQQQQQQAPQPTFVTSVTENDVLLGRGTPCAENEGNVRFRRLVKERKVEYIAAEKRMRKDAIAREILEVIASRGGKFLRKLESTTELEQLGVPHGFHSKEVWAIVDEDTQVQKVKQALRNKDDAAELMQLAAAASNSNQDKDSSNGGKYREQDVTNRFPRGVNDNESNIHKADCNLQFGTGVLERNGSVSSSEEKTAGSPKLKADGKDADKVPGSAKSSSKVVLGGNNLPRMYDAMLPPGMEADIMGPRSRRSSVDPTALASPASRRSLLGGLPPSSRQLWDKSQAAPTEAEMIRLQEMQRIRIMREQNLMDAAAVGVSPGVAAFGGLGPGGPLDAGVYGSAADLQRAQMMNVEYRQMQQQQMQMAAAAAAAREQAAVAASLCGPSTRAPGAGLMGATPSLHPSAAMTSRHFSVETQRRASLVEALGAAPSDLGDLPPQAQEKASTPGPSSKGKPGADSAGERAIGIAMAMKRAEAFSAAQSLEMSHLETLILSVLCSHGLPVWTPEAHTKSFVGLPTFAKRLDWTWYGFASVLKQKANSSGWKNNSNQPMEARDRLATEAAVEYQRDPRELATKTIMLLEKLRRHGTAAAGTSQRKQYSGLGMHVPQWLDRELSRWAMTLDVADPVGRPVAFATADFVLEHAEYKEDPAVVATAAFDPQLADDVVDQVALLTRLRSVFVKSKGHEIKSKIQGAAQKAD